MKFVLKQAFFGHSKKTQGEKKLKTQDREAKAQTQGKNSKFKKKTLKTKAKK